MIIFPIVHILGLKEILFSGVVDCYGASEVYEILLKDFILMYKDASFA
jgi:hypothetical protein